MHLGALDVRAPTLRAMNQQFSAAAARCEHDAVFSLAYLRTTEEFKRAVETPGSSRTSATSTTRTPSSRSSTSTPDGLGRRPQERGARRVGAGLRRRRPQGRQRHRGTSCWG